MVYKIPSYVEGTQKRKGAQGPLSYTLKVLLGRSGRTEDS